MTVKDLRELLKTVHALIVTFGAEKVFENQYPEARLKMKDALGQAMGCAGDAVLYQEREDMQLPVMALTAVQEFKQWFAENYKFPPQ